jgi:predicted nucleic acid-binding protein
VKETGNKSGTAKHGPDRTKALIASWDTCVFLSWLKNEPRTPSENSGILAIAKQIEKGEIIMITSALTRAEIFQGRLAKAEREKLARFFRRSNVYTLPLDDRVADLVSEIREHYSGTDFELLTPDAIHVATAIHYNADEFQTFDGSDPKRKPRDKSKKRCGLLLLDGSPIAGKHSLRIRKPDAFQLDLLANVTETVELGPGETKK